MTPQEEKAFFEKLEQGYLWRTDLQDPIKPTILRQSDFEQLLDAVGEYVPEGVHRDMILKTLKDSHRDLFNLFLDLRKLSGGDMTGLE